MGCCTPNEIGPGAEAADPCKRVNYTLGMLLGVDDFVQESAYHGARRRELAREMLGYGTVHGLRVLVEDDDDGPRIRVTPGMAWMPSGQPVCVGTDQCASINGWLKAHARELPAVPSSGEDQLALYVVLSHAECLTDNVPIPGEPCRDDSELMKPSRVADGFRLEIRTEPPPQHEEDAIRDFVEWLMRLPLAPSSPQLSEQDFVQAVRDAAKYWLDPGSPPMSPPTSPPSTGVDYMTGMAPAGTTEQLFATALRLWATELRPLWMARADCSCTAEPIAPKNDAVLLAQLDLDVVAAGTWAVRPRMSPDLSEPVRSDERQRPFVLSLRMVQELVARHPVPDPADTVVTETSFGQAAAVGNALLFARADHTHGTPVLPALGGDVSGTLDDVRIESLQGVELAVGSPLAEGDVLTVEDGKWVPKPVVLPDLAGDVSGPPDATSVDKLKGVELEMTSPLAPGDVLTVEDGKWVPKPVVLPELAGDVSGAHDATSVDKLKGVDLLVTSPLAEGDVLTVEGGKWVPKPVIFPEIPAPQAGQFVGRGTELPFEIMAAADVLLEQKQGEEPASATLQHQYGAIDVRKVSFQSATRMVVTMRIAARDAARWQGHVVKLTPVWMEKTPVATRVYLLHEVRVGRAFVEFEVLLLGDSSLMEKAGAYAFQVEVSRYMEQPR